MDHGHCITNLADGTNVANGGFIKNELLPEEEKGIQRENPALQ